MAYKKHYDWKEIQKDYDSGMTYRGLGEKHGVTFNSLANAKKRGDLVTRTLSEAGKLHFKHNPPRGPGKEARLRTSIRMSTNNPGGRSKWFTVDGKKCQGTWERDFALYCNEHNIGWDRCKPWKYVMDNKVRSYTPDFYILSKDLFIEIKGH